MADKLDDGVPAGFLPHVGEGDDPPEIFWVGKEIQRLVQDVEF